MSGQPPVQLTRFIGRHRELGDLKRLVAESRLLTMTGPGGSGKTRLAIEVFARSKGAYEGEAVWVDLASISDGSLTTQAVAKALGVAEQPGRLIDEAVTAFLGERPFLLVLDNCEHLIVACGELARSLLTACPDLHILTTSREPLALAGERVFPVPSLPVPAAGVLARAGSPQEIPVDVLEELRRYESVSLFLDRAAAVVPDFALTSENAWAIVAICRRLDGMPLSIELAAAWVNVLTADQIAGRLDDQLAFLVSSARAGVAVRHLTLQAAVDWSYELLSSPERLLLRRLSVFSGGCSLELTEAVCAGDGLEPVQVLAVLSSLVGKSLVMAETLRPGNARYWLSETIRQYAARKLADSGERPVFRDRHLRCFLQIVEESEPEIRGKNQQPWLNQWEDEYGNVRAALSWSLQSDQIEAGLRIAVTLYQFWIIRNYRGEGLFWLEQLLARANDEVSPAVRAHALAYASLMASFAGHTQAQNRYAEEAVRIGENAGEGGKEALAGALGARAFAARRSGDLQTSYVLALRQIELQRELSDRYRLGLSLSYYSFIAMSLERYEVAHAMLNEGIPMLREAGDPYRVAMALNYKGDLARCEQDYAEAISVYRESIALLREIGAVRDLASALHSQGHACLHLGDVARARALFEESMAIHREQRNTLGAAECLLGFAALAVAAESLAPAARLLAAAEAIGGKHVTQEWAATRLAYEALLERAREGLTERAFQEEQRIGRGLSPDLAAEFALKLADRAAASQVDRKKLEELTPREREVAVLVAKARSNGEIAQELVVSKRTVETHVAHILAKLEATNRSQVVRWAIESGLLSAAE